MINQLFLASLIAYIGVAFSCFIRITKIVGIIRFQDVERSNFLPAFTAIISRSIWLYYGIIIQSIPIISASVSNIFLEIIVILLSYIIMKRKNKQFISLNNV